MYFGFSFGSNETRKHVQFERRPDVETIIRQSCVLRVTVKAVDVSRTLNSIPHWWHLVLRELTALQLELRVVRLLASMVLEGPFGNIIEL